MAWRRASGRSGVLTIPAGPEADGHHPKAALPSAGTIGPRAGGIPRGRAVLGGFLIAAAAVVVFAAALTSTSRHSARYVVAAQAMAAGTIIGPGDTITEDFTLPASARAQSFGDPNVVIGRALAVGVSPGELIQASMLTPASEGAALRPVSIAVDSTSLAALAAGDQVDVLATASSAAAGSGISGSPSAGSPAGGSNGSAPAGAAPASTAGGVAVVLRGARLLAVSRANSSLAPASSAQTVVTLGVSSLADAEMVVAASHSDTITLVQAEPSDGTGSGPGPGG